MRLIDADALMEQYDLKDATKYGNKNEEQQAHSYNTMMLYEIADMIEDAPTAYSVEKIVEELEMEMKASSGYSAERVSAFSRAIEIVKQEAEKYNNGWILVSEKLPEDYETYLVTNVDSFGQRHTYKGWYGVEQKIWHMEGNSERKMNVVAWQPLPQPYQPKGEMNG